MSPVNFLLALTYLGLPSLEYAVATDFLRNAWTDVMQIAYIHLIEITRTSLELKIGLTEGRSRN